ncbi:uncharacterized protein LOC130263253 [Oenanthe melanoleuca]|uniref:uncharacterized protein LOC130263253 n=1 Tax=Oenanthe melanoleuca TaxID=2939378 RepID=UPI0024C1EB76|nr:uncharacterized protein LOC130263253 [Oenanthe melanoleuca]
MCFRWLKRLYHCLRRKCSRRNRGYSREISLGHRRFCSGSFSDGRASFTCGGEGSVSYSRRPSCWPPLPAPVPYSIPVGSSCDGPVATSGRCGLTSGWEVAVETVPVYGAAVAAGYGEDVGGGGFIQHGGDLGAGYGYSAPLSDTLTAGGVTEGAGGYGVATFPTPELIPAGGECAQVVQQKCPVVVPTAIKTQQCKQSTQWPPIQKK